MNEKDPFKLVERKYSIFFNELFYQYDDRETFYKNFPEIFIDLDFKQVEKNIKIIKNLALKFKPMIEKLFEGIFIPNIIFYIGRKSWDGHELVKELAKTHNFQELLKKHKMS